MNSQTVIIAGTGSDVGKTTMTCAISKQLALRGHRVHALKPVEAWCGQVPPTEEDGVLLACATGQESPRSALFRFRSKMVPPLAAELERVELTWSSVVERISRASVDADITLIEGAGGICTPITWQKDYSDLAVELGCPVLLLAADGILGAANMQMAKTVLDSKGARILGYVFCGPPIPDSATGTNQPVFARMSGCERIISIQRDVDVPGTFMERVDRLAERNSVVQIGDWVEGKFTGQV